MVRTDIGRLIGIERLATGLMSTGCALHGPPSRPGGAVLIRRIFVRGILETRLCDYDKAIGGHRFHEAKDKKHSE